MDVIATKDNEVVKLNNREELNKAIAYMASFFAEDRRPKIEMGIVMVINTDGTVDGTAAGDPEALASVLMKLAMDLMKTETKIADGELTPHAMAGSVLMPN